MMVTMGTAAWPHMSEFMVKRKEERSESCWPAGNRSFSWIYCVSQDFFNNVTYFFRPLIFLDLEVFLKKEESCTAETKKQSQARKVYVASLAHSGGSLCNEIYKADG